MSGENEFRDEFRRDLEAAGALTFIVHGHAFQAAGWPDLQVYHSKWTGHIEFKYARGGIKLIQTKTMWSLIARGTNAIVVRLKNDVVTFETPDGEAVMEMDSWRQRIKGQANGHLMLNSLWCACREPAMGPS